MNLVTKGEKGLVESVVSMNLEGFVCKIYCELFLLADHLAVVHYGEVFPPSTRFSLHKHFGVSWCLIFCD